MKPFRPTSTSPLLGTSLTLSTPYAAQILARSGFTFLMIDMEHSPLSASIATSLVHATTASSAGTCIPLIRVPSHGVEWIKWALDSGAAGIIVPMVNTREEAEGIVNRARYPPAGARSSGPFRAVFTSTDPTVTPEQYKSENAKDIVVLPMIESALAVSNAEAILSTPGVDGTFIGPVDLRASMGLTGADGNEEVYVEALKRITGIARRLGKVVGILAAQGEGFKKQIELGFDFYLLEGDWGLLERGGKEVLGTAMGVLGQTGR